MNRHTDDPLDYTEAYYREWEALQQDKKIITPVTKRKGIGAHQSAQSVTNTWFTPKYVTDALGHFDLDPCTDPERPWDIAPINYTPLENGLVMPWHNWRVFCNPPYSSKLVTPWIGNMVRHKNGILLLFNRSDRSDFHELIYPVADSQFLFKQRLHFCDKYGVPAKANAGGPSVLFAFGEMNSEMIAQSGLKGTHQLMRQSYVVTIVISGSWKEVVAIAIDKLGGKATVADVYAAVEKIAPDKVKKNTNYKAKIRQKLQEHFTRLSKGKYEN